MTVLVIEPWAYWLVVGCLLASATSWAWAAWVRYRESAAIKESAELRDEAQKRRDWIRKAKRQAGYDDRVSFDVVWSEVQPRVPWQTLRSQPN